MEAITYLHVIVQRSTWKWSSVIGQISLKNVMGREDVISIADHVLATNLTNHTTLFRCRPLYYHMQVRDGIHDVYLQHNVGISKFAWIVQ